MKNVTMRVHLNTHAPWNGDETDIVSIVRAHEYEIVNKYYLDHNILQE
jgi:hypothetical protein